jgi:flagellar protein FliO/FliZ
MNAGLWALPAVLLAVALPAMGADPSPATALSPAPLTSLLQVVFALLLVLAAIGVFAWLVRRVAPGYGAAGPARVVGGVMVGPRERLVVVEVGDTWLLLGVASGSVSLVHSMARPPQAPGAPTQPAPQFSRLLSQVLKQRKRGG